MASNPPAAPGAAALRVDDLHVAFHEGTREVRVLDGLAFQLSRGEIGCLLGASGCGKTTALRTIAGFVRPDAGEVLIDGRVIASPRQWVEPEHRGVGVVFQDYALFPHLDVEANVGFGLRRVSAVQQRERVARMLALVGMSDYRGRYPHELSGGQQQRVAMARAIVNKPQVLLLDEPLSALDYRLRQEMEIELKRIHRKLGITFVFVTHDQEEAISMSDRIAVMNQGRIEQIGTPTRIYEEPENMFVAKFVGEINIFEGRITEVYNGSATVDIHGQSFKVLNRKNFTAGEHVKVLLRPEDLAVTRDEDSRPVPPSLGGVIDEVIYKGKTVDLIVSLDAGEVIFVTQFFNEDQEDVIFRQGQRIHVDWPYGWEVVL